MALDFRGRGESEWAEDTYTIPPYVADVLALLDALALGAVPVVGTSLGGLVGPEIDPRGAARSAAYLVGGTRSPPISAPRRAQRRE